MRFHLVGLPHTETTREFEACAYTTKVRRFAGMMRSLGHEVILYAGEANEADVDEHVVCISRSEQAELATPEFDVDLPHWQLMNRRAVDAIATRKEPHDFLCVIGGVCQQPIAQAHPELMCVEWGVGYGGVFADYRVFESYAWMHTVYGATMGAHSADGRFYDTVIPNFFDPADFPFEPDKDDYLLYVGRLVDRKGVHVAAQVAQHLGVRLLVAGEGPNPPAYGELVGVVGPEERAKLMGRARALIAPTLYVEPFGGVVAEAQLCGTPVITTDWGAFTETVDQGVTGFRCHTLQDFVAAARTAHTLDPARIRHRALGLWSTDVVRHSYDAYFRRLLTLWDAGWSTLEPVPA